MEEYFNTHSSDFIYGGIGLAVVVVLYLLTTLLHKWILKKRRKRFNSIDTTPINLVKRVLNALWIVLGMIFMSFIFVEEEDYGAMNDHFKLVLYLGVAAILTILAATSANLWFKRSIARKVLNEQDPTNFKFLRYVAMITIYFTGSHRPL